MKIKIHQFHRNDSKLNRQREGVENKSEDPSSRDDRMRDSWSLRRSLRTVKREFWLQFEPVASDRRPSVRMSLMKKAIGGSIHRIREFELEKVTRLERIESSSWYDQPSFFPSYSLAALFHPSFYDPFWWLCWANMIFRSIRSTKAIGPIRKRWINTINVN